MQNIKIYIYATRQFITSPKKQNKGDISYADVCLAYYHHLGSLATLRNILCVGHVPSTSPIHIYTPPTSAHTSHVDDRINKKARVIKTYTLSFGNVQSASWQVFLREHIMLFFGSFTLHVVLLQRRYINCFSPIFIL